MPIGPPFMKKREPGVDIGVYTKPVDVASGNRLSCEESAAPVARFARGCPSAFMGT